MLYQLQKNQYSRHILFQRTSLIKFWPSRRVVLIRIFPCRVSDLPGVSRWSNPEKWIMLLISQIRNSVRIVKIIWRVKILKYCLNEIYSLCQAKDRHRCRLQSSWSIILRGVLGGCEKIQRGPLFSYIVAFYNQFFFEILTGCIRYKVPPPPPPPSMPLWLDQTDDFLILF